MQGQIARSVPRGMAVLGFIEAGLSSVATYCAIQVAALSTGTPAGLRALAGDNNVALALAAVLGAFALVIGLYRPTVGSRRRWMLTATALPAAVAFAVLVIPGDDVRPGLAADALAASAIFAGKVLGAWLLTIALIRLVFGIAVPRLTAEGVLAGTGYASGKATAAAKRATDVAVSLAMAILTLPLMVLTALAIKADSPGPVLYRQQRIGAFDRPFTVLKFRSMTADAEAGGRPRWAQKQDPRVTRVGRFIRATRIDELPQLVNVIRGEMSLVGPRPERPHFVEQLAEAIPFYRQRAYVKPGLTGWAQVNYPYGASIEDAREKLAYDLYYVKNRSLWLDMRILLATVRVVLFQEGAR